MIYLASPYSSLKGAVRRWRFKRACQAAAFFMRQGLHVFSPIAHSHPIVVCDALLPKDWPFWETQDRWYIDRADEVRVLMLPGWGDSVGVAAEIEIATRLGKPVSYWFWVNGELQLCR